MAMCLCEWLVVPLLARLCFVRVSLVFHSSDLMQRFSLVVIGLTGDTGGIHHFWTEAI